MLQSSKCWSLTITIFDNIKVIITISLYFKKIKFLELKDLLLGKIVWTMNVFSEKFLIMLIFRDLQNVHIKYNTVGFICLRCFAF